MHEFDAWLIERLTYVGALALGDPEPDVRAALRLYQESESLPATGIADDVTINLLRRRRSPNPESPLIIFEPAPPRTGSQYVPQELAAA
jgi:hypothetical protein